MKSLSSINVTPATKPVNRCWILDDARPGHLHQSLALVSALQLGVCPQRVRLPEALQRSGQLEYKGRQGLLIGCGRRAAWYSRKIKQRQPALWTNIQILDPRNSRSGFDWILAPRHDGISGPHVIGILGALSEIDSQHLDNARNRLPRFAEQPKPHLALLVGAPTRRAGWQKNDLKSWLAQMAKYLQVHGGSASVLNSRRSPAWVNTLLRKFSQDAKNFYPHDGERNPYSAVLATADYLWVTADSVNMLADACSTARPVRALGEDKIRGRIAEFWRQLDREERLVRDWHSPGAGPWAGLREARRVATELRRRGALLAFEEALP